MVEQWQGDNGTVWWNSETMLVEQWNSVGETVAQYVMVEQCGGTMKQ